MIIIMCCACVEAVKKSSKEDLTDACVCVHEASSMLHFQMLNFHISVSRVCFWRFLFHVWLLTLCITEPDFNSLGFTIDLIR